MTFEIYLRPIHDKTLFGRGYDHMGTHPQINKKKEKWNHCNIHQKSIQKLQNFDKSLSNCVCLELKYNRYKGYEIKITHWNSNTGLFKKKIFQSAQK